MKPPMNNWKSPDQKQEPISADMPLEERLRALEQQVAEHRKAADAATPPDAQGPHAWRPGMAMPEAPAVARLATVSADLDAHRDRLHTAEMSLVDRIADVDDERRRATTRLQKAWQVHRDEVDDQLRRHTWSTVALLVLFAVLIGGALIFVYLQIGAEQQQLSSQVAEIASEMNHLSASAPEPAQQGPDPALLSARLDELSAAVATLSDKSRRIESELASNQQQAPDARLAAEIKQLEDRQQLASQELESLRETLGATQTIDEEPAQSTETATPSQTTASQESDAVDPRGQESIIVGDQPFALQLIGFRSRNSLMEFARRNDLPARVYFREETYQGRPWFVMIHSLHESADDAAAELARLPDDLAALGPWIRTMSEGSELLVLDTPQSD